MIELETKWTHLSIPKENPSASEAERLMLQYLEMREDWVSAYVQATKHEDLCKWKYESAYNVAFLRSQETSDKKRDIDAQEKCKAEKLALISARADVVKAKLKVEGAVLGHHALKAIYNEASQERRYL